MRGSPMRNWRCSRPVAAIASLACSASSRRGASKFTQKLVILGFDGMDPHLLEAMDGRGQAAATSRSSRSRAASIRCTTHSPESPTAWASFATGVNAGKHNIYDFLVRDTSTYLPDLGMVQRDAAEVPVQLHSRSSKPKRRLDPRRHVVLGHGREGRRAVRRPHRAGHLSARGRRRTASCSSGLPLPDIRGTMGTFYYFATDLSRYEEGNTEFGGILKRLVFEGDTAHDASSTGRRTRSSGSRSRRSAARGRP